MVSVNDWRRLGAPTLKPVQIRLRSATGDDMGVSGSFVLRGWCDDRVVEMTALVSTRATRSLCSATKLVNAGYSILMKPDQSFLRHSGGGSILLQRYGKRDFLSIRVMKIREINAITFTTMKREVESLQSELRALRTGHLPTSEVRLPWSIEEKHRHEVNGHAEYDNRCEICVKSSGISRHPRRVYSESCAFDYASVTFKGSDGCVTVLTGRGPRCECFCRVVPRKGQRLKDLEHFLAVMRARYPSLQVRSDNDEALKHVLKDACEKMNLENSNTRLETPASNGRGENSVRTIKEMVQRQKDAVVTLGIEFSVKHPLFALLVRHSEWILNHLVLNDFLVEEDNRVIKTSPYESHTGNPAPRSTSFLNRILVGRREDDDKQPRFQQAWFLGLIGGSDEVIALHTDGVQRHHGELRVSPQDDPETNLRELKAALGLMTECDWRTPGCKTCHDVRYHKGWHSVECRERVLLATVPDTMSTVSSTKRLLDTGANDVRDDYESKRHKTSDDLVSMAKEPSSGSGMKRSNFDSLRRADAEAEKALTFARVLEERRAAKRESATSLNKLEESAENAEVTAESLMIAAEATLSETRETIQALTVSALEQVHEMIHRPETTT